MDPTTQNTLARLFIAEHIAARALRTLEQIDLLRRLHGGAK